MFVPCHPDDVVCVLIPCDAGLVTDKCSACTRVEDTTFHEFGSIASPFGVLHAGEGPWSFPGMVQ